MNAMLKTERLPTGIVPLTSVITTVHYGSKERAYIEHEGWSFPHEISLDALPQYITQQYNPGNQRRVAVASVELPAELLRRGFYFVDTPGLGSSIKENTRTTEQFLPEVDAFIIVTSYDSPLSEEEVIVLEEVAFSPGRIFIVVNKQDTASSQERGFVIDHIREQLADVFGDVIPSIFSISAREALEAIRTHDEDRLAASGVFALQDALVHFLLTQKETEFLLRMSERILGVLGEFPGVAKELTRLTDFYTHLENHEGITIGDNPSHSAATVDISPRFTHCVICQRIERGVYEVLCKYQYNITVPGLTQTGLVEHGGLCAFHTWQYDAIASPRGTCLGFSPLLENLAARLRHSVDVAGNDAQSLREALEALRPTDNTCDICRARSDIERAAASSLGQILIAETEQKSLSLLCFPHLAHVVGQLEDGGLLAWLLLRQAAVFERLSEDMKRFVLRLDGARRRLISAEENSAAHRALMSLAGHRNVNGAVKPASDRF
jgi:hypothetical protein